MLTWLLALIALPPALAQEPVWQRVTRAHGLDTNWVRDLYQGPDRRIFMGTSVGVFAWDGDRARRMDGGQIRTEIQRLAAWDGRLFARDKRGRVWLIDGDQSRQVQIAGQDLIAADIAGTDTGLAFVAGGEIHELGADGTATRLIPSVSDARRIWSAPDGLVIAAQSGWLRARGQAAVTLHHPTRAFPEDALVASDGTVWVGDGDGVWTVSETGPPVLRLSADRTRIALTERNGAVWAAGESLTRFSETGIAQSWSSTDGFRGRGHALMTDHEGGLWTGSGEGVGYIAEPSLVRWKPHHGIADRAPRRMAWTPDALWVSHWTGFSVIRAGQASEEARAFEPSEPCVDAEGTAWFLDVAEADSGEIVLRALTEHRETTWPATSHRHYFEACHTDEEGQAWLTDGSRLIRARGEAWTNAGSLPKPKGRSTLRALHVARGVAAYTTDRAFCQADVSDLTSPLAWRCVDVGGDQHITDVNLDEYGYYWVLGSDDTVLVGDLDGWRSPRSAAELPGTYMVFAEPSPRGGMWIGGEGPVQRVTMEPGADDWQVLETIDGLVEGSLSMPVDMVETPDGTLYLTVRIGVIALAPEARDRTLPPPKVTLVEVRTDGERHEIGPDAPVQLAHADTRLRLDVAVHSYRSRGDLVVRSRLDDGPWSAPTDARTLEWAALSPGSRSLSIQASRGGQAWGPPTTLSVQVPLRWYGRWQVWALIALALAAAGVALWRVRLQALLREERLRGRVAMDLHDEVGGELGALRLLVGLLGRELPEEQREDVSRRAGHSLAALTASVRGIVWSLQPARRDLQGLANHLVERARTALPHLGQRLSIHVELPSEPVLLDLDVVRGVRLIVREALHNIAKHSGATAVSLIVDGAGRGRWRVQVIDDGMGFDLEARAESGSGLASMRARAADMGGVLQIHSDPNGTRIALEFRGI